MQFKIYQVDAFTDQPFKGNPAAVVPLQEWIDDELMQQIAAENNLSETAFFVPDNSSDNTDLIASYHIRWFTPDAEIDLCGHATLASAFIVKRSIKPQVQKINFSTLKAGTLNVTCVDEGFTLDFPSRMPEKVQAPPGLLESLGIKEALDILRSRDYFIVLSDEDAVKNIKPDFILLKQIETVGVIVTARGKSADVVSRCFYPRLGIPEDPVTGSAHCNIIPYWCQQLGVTKFFAKQLSQRGGDLWCELKGDRVLMTGKGVLFLEGDILIS